MSYDEKTINVKAVVFDYDDTLVEFKKFSLKGLEQVSKEISKYVEEEGFPQVSKDYVFKVLKEVADQMDSEGIYDRNRWWEQTLEVLGIKVKDLDVLTEWTNLYWSFASINPPYDDAIESIEYIKNRGYKIGILTNSDGSGMDKRRRVNKFPMIKYIDYVLIAGEGGTEPKPHPRAFIEICYFLGFNPRECLVVGNDPIKDCKGGKEAGMKTVLVDRAKAMRGFPNYVDYIISDLRQLQDML